MKKVSLLVYAVAILLTSSMVWAQSLGEIADRERQRRKDIQDEKVITNKDAEQYKNEASSAQTASDQPPAGEEGTKPEQAAPEAAGTDNADSDEPVDMQGKTESHWRKTMTEARQKVTDLENEANALALKINDLQGKYNGVGLSGAGDNFQKAAVQREMQKAYYEQDLNKENLTKAKAALQELENEARKNGALPGWIEAPRR